MRHLYVHVPFCARRCAYCDFAIAVRKNVPVEEYLLGVERELDLRFNKARPARQDGDRQAGVGARRARDEVVGEMPRGQGDDVNATKPPDLGPLATLYLGGGTPSLLGPSGVRRLIDIVRARTTLAPGAEVTIEANPDDVTPDAAAAWREAGIGRVSLGAQSFDPAVLAWMHRTHTVEAIGRAVEAIREAGIDNFSLDLIFALPAHLRRDWRRDLDLALELSPPHVSLYGLTVEAGTPVGRWVERGSVAEAPEESYEREYLEAHERLTAAGLEHYEVSNYGRPGFRSRHNSAYWSGAAYAGIGPSAHEFDGNARRWNVPAYAEWAKRLAAGEDPAAGVEVLTDENRETERVYLGLRTDAGLAIGKEEMARVTPWIEQGWATLDGAGTLRLTPLGWLRLDALAGDLTVLRSRY